MLNTRTYILKLLADTCKKYDGKLNRLKAQNTDKSVLHQFKADSCTLLTIY